jgi:hypothetical protein
MCRDILDSEIGIAQAYQKIITDDIDVGHSQRTFHKVYSLVPPSLTSKTRETAFQVLNNKAFKSKKRPDTNCERCRARETIEHLL